ncbi:hypothetical protein OBBRIDRAFT_844895, partial [Obba rivulosa]
ASNRSKLTACTDTRQNVPYTGVEGLPTIAKGLIANFATIITQHRHSAVAPSRMVVETPQKQEVQTGRWLHSPKFEKWCEHSAFSRSDQKELIRETLNAGTRHSAITPTLSETWATALQRPRSGRSAFFQRTPDLPDSAAQDDSSRLFQAIQPAAVSENANLPAATWGDSEENKDVAER